MNETDDTYVDCPAIAIKLQSLSEPHQSSETSFCVHFFHHDQSENTIIFN